MRPNGEGIAAILMCLIATVALAGFNDFCLTGFSLTGGGQCSEQSAVALITPSNKAFGTYTAGEVARQEFVVTNSGKGTFSNLSGSTTGTGFSIYSSHKCAAAPCTFKTRFSPAVQGTYTGHLRVISDQFPVSLAALSGTGVAAVSQYIFGRETFEATADPCTTSCVEVAGTWAKSLGGAGTAVFDSTTTPGAGSQSLRITPDAIISYVRSPVFVGTDTTYYHFMLRVSGNPASVSDIFSTYSAANHTGQLVYVRHNTDGTLSVRDGTRAAVTTATLSANTWYHVWVRAVKGTGADGVASVAFSETTTEPTTGTAYATFTNGALTTNAVTLDFRARYSITNDFDEVIVDDSPITP